MEIGAGYGRTCHTIFANHDIAEYCVIDLPGTLQLSRKYLAEVLSPQQYEKVVFVPVDAVEESLHGKNFDLCVNVDSMAEMDAGTARAYLALIDEVCTHFYVNNPIGKFLDKSLDDHARGQEAVRLALSTGLLTDVIDIHDNSAVEGQAQKYVTAYRPAAGWTCVADDWAQPWSFYWQALYRKAG